MDYGIRWGKEGGMGDKRNMAWRLVGILLWKKEILVRRGLEVVVALLLREGRITEGIGQDMRGNRWLAAF